MEYPEFYINYFLKSHVNNPHTAKSIIKEFTMKPKTKLLFYIFSILLLAHAMLVVGCGSNPFLGILFNTVTVAVVKF